MSARRGGRKLSALSRRLLVWALDSARSRAADVWTIASDLIHELRRLNGLGVRSDERGNAGRRARAAVMRERLEMSYRHHTPCC
jgi:hypothetical protein